MTVTVSPLRATPNTAQVEAVAQAYDKVAPTYDATYQHPKDWAEDRIVAEQLDAAGIHDRQTDDAGTRNDVLDLGCGTGVLLDLVNVTPQHYLGVDVSRGMLAQALKKHPEHVFDCSSADDTGLADSSFDCAAALYGVWNYLLNPFTGVAELFRLLRPGGHVVLIVYTPRHARRRSYVLANNPVFRRFYTAEDVYSFMAPYFENIEVRGLSYVVDWLPRWTPRWLALAVSRVEQELLSRAFPSLAFSMIVTATKRRV